MGEELPRVFSMVGAPAIPALTAYLADAAHGLFARIAAAHGLEWISRRYAATREQSLAALSAQLELYAGQDPTLNGFLVSYLLDLKAVEAAPLIERAFAANRIDLSVMGDWEDAQVELGLKATREKPRAKYNLLGPLTQPQTPAKKRKKR